MISKDNYLQIYISNNILYFKQCFFFVLVPNPYSDQDISDELIPIYFCVKKWL